VLSASCSNWLRNNDSSGIYPKLEVSGSGIAIKVAKESLRNAGYGQTRVKRTRTETAETLKSQNRSAVQLDLCPRRAQLKAGL